MKCSLVRLLFVAVVGLLVSPSAGAQETCKRIVSVPFQCTVGACSRTVNVNVCQSLTTSSFDCAGCNSTRGCCGVDVCTASYIGTCKGPNPNIVFALARLPKSVSARLLIPQCNGGYSSYRAGA